MTKAETEFLRLVLMYGVKRIPMDEIQKYPTWDLLWASQGNTYFGAQWNCKMLNIEVASVTANGMEILKRLGYQGQ